MNDLGNKKIFSNNLQYYMKINNLERNDVCKHLNLAYTTFTDWYNGNSYPGIEKIELLANYFGIEKSDLIESKNNLDKMKTKALKIPVLGRIPARNTN